MGSNKGGKDMSDREDWLERWRIWHPGLDTGQTDQQFNNWYELYSRHQTLNAIAGKYSIYTSPRFAEARKELGIANNRLQFEVPYRVIVLGESGAGKSTFVNALIGRDLLPAAPGGAITGAATYITISQECKEEKAEVVYRDDPKFNDLLERMAKRYNLAIADSPEAILKSLSQPDQSIFKDPLSERHRRVLRNDLEDIATTWISLRKRGKLGKTETYDPVKDHDQIMNLIGEQEGDNQFTGKRSDAEKRSVPGIQHVFYTLRPDASAMHDLRAMEHVLIIDAPGSGAGRTLRHDEILYAETEQADAIILVLNALRPAGNLSQDMAELVESVFFLGLAEEWRTKSASRVFIIANRFDDVLSDSNDREKNTRRLNDSIQVIANLIAPEYWEKYCAEDSADKHYFCTMAQLSVLARKVRWGAPTDQETQSYKTYAPLFEDSASSPEQMEKESNVPDARNHIQQFLSNRRVTVMLDEVRARLEAAHLNMRNAAQAMFPQTDGTNPAGLKPSEARLQHIQEACHKVLAHSREALKTANKQMLQALDTWRREEHHTSNLTMLIEDIYKKFDDQMREELTKQEPELVRIIREDTTGREIIEGLPRTLALEVERRLRESVRLHSRDLANYYLNHFERETASPEHNLKKLMQQMTYGQAYVGEDHLEPLHRLDQAAASLRQNFTSICEWTLLYELIKRPILVSSAGSQREKSIWQVLKRTTPDLVGLSLEVALLAAGMSHLSAEVLKILGRAFLEERQDKASSIDPSANSQILKIRQAAEEELVQAIHTQLLASRFDEVKSTLLSQFGRLYRSAFAAALPQIESLFFYEASRYSREFDRLSEHLINLHRSHVAVQKDAPICKTLLKEGKVDLGDFNQAIDLFMELEQLPPLPRLDEGLGFRFEAAKRL
jgi:hypothetical protein